MLEQRECLYNTTIKDHQSHHQRHSFYHNRDKRRSAIQEIATALTATGSTLYNIIGWDQECSAVARYDIVLNLPLSDTGAY